MEVAALPPGISNGIVTAGVLAGRLGSRTRAELAVGLAAWPKPFPVNFGTDSKAFCDKANSILDAPRFGQGAPMLCKGMAICGSFFMKVCWPEALILSTPRGTRRMLLLMPFVRELCAPTALSTAALPIMLPAGVTLRVGARAWSSSAVTMPRSRALTQS